MAAIGQQWLPKPPGKCSRYVVSMQSGHCSLRSIGLHWSFLCRAIHHRECRLLCMESGKLPGMEKDKRKQTLGLSKNGWGLKTSGGVTACGVTASLTLLPFHLLLPGTSNPHPLDLDLQRVDGMATHPSWDLLPISPGMSQAKVRSPMPGRICIWKCGWMGQ